jgi:hypothetical protein
MPYESVPRRRDADIFITMCEPAREQKVVDVAIYLWGKAGRVKEYLETRKVSCDSDHATSHALREQLAMMDPVNLKYGRLYQTNVHNMVVHELVHPSQVLDIDQYSYHYVMNITPTLALIKARAEADEAVRRAQQQKIRASIMDAANVRLRPGASTGPMAHSAAVRFCERSDDDDTATL